MSYKDYKQNLASADQEESSDKNSDQDEPIEIVVAKMVLDKPYVCHTLKSAKVKESIMSRTKEVQCYSFDIIKLDEIFDLLL